MKNLEYIEDEEDNDREIIYEENPSEEKTKIHPVKVYDAQGNLKQEISSVELKARERAKIETIHNPQTWHNRPPKKRQ